MYKALTIILLVVIGASCVSGLIHKQPKKLQRLSSDLSNQKVGVDLCPLCINEVVELINVVLNVILDEGIIASCGDLCGAVANKTGSKIAGDLCDVVCEAFGIDEFIKLIVKADIDPIYYCQLVDMCPIKDDGDAKFTNFGVFPKTAPEGTTFAIDLSFETVNGTGTGTFTFNIIDPKNQTSGDLYWFEAKKPGKYTERIGFPTYSLSNCDPSKEVCAGFPLGVYNISAQICNGECGSHHPHTSIYDTQFSSFEVTKKKE